MPSPSLLKLQAAMPGAPAVDHPRPERLLHGKPRRESWPVASTPIAGAVCDSGVWRCEPGHWRIVFDAQSTELFTVLSGRCRLHDSATGGCTEVGPGEGLLIPPGFVGSFEVLETVTKTYAVIRAAG